MSISSDDPALSTANPFTPTAVASVAELDTDTVTVVTLAIRQARSYLDAYLAATPESLDTPAVPGAGNVIAIVGDYGTGKTHLVVELLRHARRSAGTNAHVVYVDGQPAGFVALYRRFVDELREADVLDQVREYYADVVAESLHDSELTERIAERLRDRDVDPQLVVERLGLMEAALLQEVRLRLQQVSRNDAFGTALTLLLRPGFRDAVWRWLSGDAPDQILVERGITTAIDTAETALEAMGVFALLYGHRHHRFILVIDELEKVLSGSRQRMDVAVAAFKKLLTVFADARAFLVLAGLPDFLQVIGPDVQQRIGRVVHMSPLDGEEAQKLIRESQRRLFGVDRLEPFTPESVDYLVQLADGTARKIIRLCYHAYRRAVEEGSPVTEAMVREVARTHTNVLSTDDIRAKVARSLGKEGWEHSTNHLLGSPVLTWVDEWVYSGDRGSGSGIIVTDSVLDNDAVDELNRRARAIQGAVPGTQTLLIVNGYIDDDSMAQLHDAFGVQPLVYDPRSFDEDLPGMIRAMMGRTGAGGEGDNTIEAVRDRVERINRQQSATYRFIEQLAVHLDAMRSSSERRLDSVQRELVAITEVLYGSHLTAGKGRGDDVRRPTRMPADVSQLFSDAFDSLADIGQVDVMLRQAFAVSPDRSSRGLTTSMEARAALRSQHAAGSLGVAVLLQKLVEAFRQSVDEWYRSYDRDSRGRLLPADEEQLRGLCRTYDAIYEYLPLFQLSGLTEFTALPTGAESEVAQASRLARGGDVRETLDGLGARVQRTMLDAVTSSTGNG
jgi:Cdc6-like AAA superfamily ATPase